MTEHAQETPAPQSSERTDQIIRIIIMVLAAALIGAALLFGYTVWQTSRIEKSATPAQRALIELENFVRKEPNNAAGRVRYGEALASAGLFKQAGEQFKAAVKLDEKHTGAWLDLGLVAMQNDDANAAERYFLKVVDLTAGSQYEDINARREQALFHLGEISLNDRRYEEAAGYFKNALRIRKDASDSYYLLAQSFWGMDKPDAAVKQLDAALAFDPNYAEAHFLYGKILLKQNDKVNAAVHFVKAAELAPDVKEAQDALKSLGTSEDALAEAKAALSDKDFDRAIEAVLLARTLDATAVEPAILHAKILIAKGDLKSAKNVAAEAAKLDAGNPEVKALQSQLGK